VLRPDDFESICHPREGGDPLYLNEWIPFFKGMTLSYIYWIRTLDLLLLKKELLHIPAAFRSGDIKTFLNRNKLRNNYSNLSA